MVFLIRESVVTESCFPPPPRHSQARSAQQPAPPPSSCRRPGRVSARRWGLGAARPRIAQLAPPQRSTPVLGCVDTLWPAGGRARRGPRPPPLKIASRHLDWSPCRRPWQCSRALVWCCRWEPASRLCRRRSGPPRVCCSSRRVNILRTWRAWRRQWQLKGEGRGSASLLGKGRKIIKISGDADACLLRKRWSLLRLARPRISEKSEHFNCLIFPPLFLLPLKTYFLVLSGRLLDTWAI